MYKAAQNSSINGTDTGFTGFLMPKFLNGTMFSTVMNSLDADTINIGTWGFQDPIFCSPLLNFTSCYLNPDGHETYEGS